MVDRVLPPLLPYKWSKGENAVYLIVNNINNKIYVGISKQQQFRRKANHLYAARTNKKTRMAAAIRKYGEGAFSFHLIEKFATYDEALTAEIRWIATLKPEYNVLSGGGDGRLFPVSPETRAKLSAASKGRINGFLGRKHSEESRALMSEANLANPRQYWKGKKRPPETIERMRQAKLKNPTRYWLGKNRSEETIQENN